MDVTNFFETTVSDLDVGLVDGFVVAPYFSTCALNMFMVSECFTYSSTLEDSFGCSGDPYPYFSLKSLKSDGFFLEGNLGI